MLKNTNTKEFVAFYPWILPLFLVLPYAFVASSFRGLVWVWQTGYQPFWLTLGFLIILAAIANVLIWNLHEIGNTLLRVGIGVAALQTTYLAMSERRHSLLILIFVQLVIGVFLSEQVKRVLKLPFYDSKRKWWEAYPKGIPGLTVELLGENGDNAKGRLSNFGADGCFVFSIEEPIQFRPKSVKITSEEETLLAVDVEPVISTKDGFGWGLRFHSSALDGDWGKDLQDYLGYLRRLGYEIV